MSDLVDRLRNLFGDLAPRERMLLAAAGTALLVAILWLGLVNPVMASIDQARLRVVTAERDLLQASQLRGELSEIQGRLSSVEQRIKRGPKGNIFTTLEDLAKKSAVKVESMEPQTSPSEDRYRETKVELVLKAVTLAQAVNFLHRIESTPQLLSIKSLRVRTRKDKSDLIDVTFTVSSFESR